DHETWLEAVIAVIEGITENEAPFGIRIDDFDRLSRHGGDDIARTLGVTVRHVFHKADDADSVDLSLARRKRVHQADHGSRATHIALHVFHSSTGFDGNAPRIED